MSNTINGTAANPISGAGGVVRWAFVALLFVAAGLRFFDLDARELWLDEAFSWNQATLSFSDMLASVARDVHPPLYQIILWCNTRLLGDSSFALRLPSAIFSLVAVVLTYRLTRAISCKPSALLAMAFASIATFQLWYAQEARMYSLLAMLALGSMIMLLQMLQSPARRNTAAYIVVSVLLLYTHVYGAFIVLAQSGCYALLWLWRQTPEHLPWPRWFRIQLFIAVLYLPWLWVLLDQISAVQNSFWIPKPGVVSLLQTLHTYQSLVSPLFFASVALAAAGLWKGPVRTVESNGMSQRLQNNSLLLTWLCVPLLVPFLLSQFMQPVYLARYTIASAFPWYILIAMGVSSLPRKLAAAAAFILLAGAVANLPAYYTNRLKDAQWAQVTQYIDAHASPGDSLVFHADYGSLPYRYHGDPAAFSVLNIDSGTDPALNGIPLTALSSQLNREHDVWLIESYTMQLPVASADVISTIEATHSLQEEKQFGVVWIRHFSADGMIKNKR